MGFRTRVDGRRPSSVKLLAMSHLLPRWQDNRHGVSHSWHFAWLDKRSLKRWGGQESAWTTLKMVLASLLIFAKCSSAVYIDFDNCLSPGIIHSMSENPTILQFTPYNVWVSFDSVYPSHSLNITVYGNIFGVATNVTRPDQNDPQWDDPTKTVGKIVDEDATNHHWTTLFARFNVLDYTPYDAPASRFCNSTIHQQCPLKPAFKVTNT